MQRTLISAGLAMLVAVTAIPAAGKNQQELAQQLSNPIAALISMPLQTNYDQNIGPVDDGERWTMNIQPVIPVDLAPEWNLISRSILPLISQEHIFPGAGNQFGTGDLQQSLILSPKAPTDSGWIWGAGGIFLLPTASDDLLGSDTWGAGPTAIALKLVGPWTFGALVNHVTDVAGDNDHLNASFVQPFLVYTNANATSFAVNTETSYDWDAEETAMPINFQVNQVSKIGSQMVQYGGGLRYWLESPDSGPEGFALRFNFVLLFPK